MDNKAWAWCGAGERNLPARLHRMWAPASGKKYHAASRGTRSGPSAT